MKIFSILLFIPLIGLSQIQIGERINGEFSSGDFSGRSTSLSADGKILAIGAPISSENGFHSGYAKVYEEVNGIWSQIGQTISNGSSVNRAGKDVSLSSDGSTLAVGFSLSEDGNGNGKVRIYSYDNSNNFWSQIGSDIDGEIEFTYLGWNVSLSSDGNRVAMSAPSINAFENGKVKIFENINNNWVQLGNDIVGVFGDVFGNSVSLSSDGLTVAIGAPYNDDIDFRNGLVQIYEYDGTSWNQKGQDLYGLPREVFGNSVSLSGDGEIVAIGAPKISTDEVIGVVRVYEFNGTNWEQIGLDLNGIVERDLFGNSVSISETGDLIAIGAPEIRNTSDGDKLGYSFLYQNNNNQWEQVGIAIPGVDIGDNSGYSVSISDDGIKMATGAPSDSDSLSNAGHVRVFSFEEFLSIDDLSQIETILIRPNPTSNNFIIESNSAIEIRNISLYNNLGQLIITTNQKNIDVNTLQKGVYYVKINTLNNFIVRKLIIN